MCFQVITVDAVGRRTLRMVTADSAREAVRAALHDPTCVSAYVPGKE